MLSLPIAWQPGVDDELPGGLLFGANADWQRSQPACKSGSVLRRHAFRRSLEIRQPIQNRFEGAAKFEPGNIGSHAEMRAYPE